MCIEYPHHFSFTAAASQRVAVLVARVKDTRSGFVFDEFMRQITSLLNDLENQNYTEENGSCLQPINFDASADIRKISRSKSLDEWFTVLYTRMFWMFRYCDKGVGKQFMRRLKTAARRVERSHKYSFQNLTDDQLEKHFTTGES